MTSAALLDVIGRIYDAALAPPLWQEVVRSIAELQDCDKALLFTTVSTPKNGGFAFSHGISEQTLQLRAERFVEHDIWTRAGLEKGVFQEGNVVTDEDLVPLDVYLQSVLYTELGIRDDIVRLCAGIVFGAQTPGVMPATLNVFRGLKDPPFGAHERRLHSLLVPHVSRAMGVMCRLRDSEMRIAMTLAALDALPTGVVVFRSSGSVLFANRTARRLLAEDDGLRLALSPRGTESLVASAEKAQRHLQAALMQCLGEAALEVPHFSRAIAIERPSGRAPYAIHVSALPYANEFGSGADNARAIAFITDPAEPVRLDAALLARVYGLTAAELRVAERVCEGRPLAEIAQLLNLSENTVKSQLHAVFEKTQTRRQAELIKLLLSLASTRGT